MTLESLYPFLLIIAPFALAFLLEALVMYFFKLKSFWGCLGRSIVINLLSLLVIYGCSVLLTGLNYEFNGLRLPLQVVLFFWWVSSITDALFLKLFLRKRENKTLFLCSIAMNALSYLFLYFFIVNSH